MEQAALGERELTEEEKERIHRIYRLFDSNGNGKIKAYDLVKGARVLGMNPTLSEAEDMVKECDVDSDGYIDFREFEAFMRRQILMVEYQTSMLEIAFKRFDTDKSGFLDKKQLSHALRNFGDKFTEEEEAEFFRLADTNQDGKVSLEEFIALMTSA